MLPNFLIVGAAKSGTTSLFKYLNQHPEVFIPQLKECRFFSNIPRDFTGLQNTKTQQILDEARRNIPRSIEEYEALFSGATNKKALGDISPDYLYYYEESIKNIVKYLGNKVKIVIILRNPIERAESFYYHAIRESMENLSFEEAIKAEPTRIANNWWVGYHLIQYGYYYKQVKAYLDNFDHVKVYLYDDLKKSARSVMQDIYSFIGVDKFVPDTRGKYNSTGINRNTLFRMIATSRLVGSSLKWYLKMTGVNDPEELIGQILNNYLLFKPKMAPNTRNKLIELYRDDVAKLSVLLKRDLNHWLS